MYTNYVQKYAGVSEDGKPQWYYTDKQTGEMKTTTTYYQADLYLSLIHIQMCIRDSSYP